MGLERIRVATIEKKIDSAFTEEDSKLSLHRSYVCCGKYDFHEYYNTLPNYCCPKRYQICNETYVFKKGCFEAMLDHAQGDEVFYFCKHFVLYFIFIGFAICIAAAEASYLRYRRY